MKLQAKRFLSILLTLCMLFSLISCGDTATDETTTNNSNQNLTETEARTAILFQVENAVCVVREEEAIEGYAGMRLMGGDTVIVAQDAQAYLRIDDDKNIVLDSDSAMTISELKTGKLLLTLEAGYFFFDVQNKLADDETMEIDVGGTTMSIRGTIGDGSRAIPSEDLPGLMKAVQEAAQISQEFLNIDNFGTSRTKSVIQLYEGKVGLKDTSNNEVALKAGEKLTLVKTEDGVIVLSENTVVETANPTEIFSKYLAETEGIAERLEETGVWSQDNGGWKATPAPEQQTEIKLAETTTSNEETTTAQQGIVIDPIGNIPSVVTGACGKHSGYQGSFDLTKHALASCGMTGHYICDGKDHTTICAICQLKHHCEDNEGETCCCCGKWYCSSCIEQPQKLKCKYCEKYICDDCGDTHCYNQQGTDVGASTDQTLSSGVIYACPECAKTHLCCNCGLELGIRDNIGLKCAVCGGNLCKICALEDTSGTPTNIYLCSKCRTSGDGNP